MKATPLLILPATQLMDQNFNVHHINPQSYFIKKSLYICIHRLTWIGYKDETHNWSASILTLPIINEWFIKRSLPAEMSQINSYTPINVGHMSLVLLNA